MRQITVITALLALAASSLVLGGCGSGTKTYAPIVDGGEVEQTTYTITVEANLTPNAVKGRDSGADATAYYPGSAEYTVTVSSTDGFVGTVNLETLGLPSTVTGILGASSVTLNSSTTSVTRSLTVSPNGSEAADGVWHTFTVRGTSGGRSVTSNTARVRVIWSS